MVRSRRILALLAVTCACLLAVGFTGRASAAQLENVIVPVSGQIFNPCNGEVVTFTGSFHLLFNITVNPNGGFHIVEQDNAIDIKGVGSDGNNYSGSEHDSLVENLTPGALNFTAEGSFAETSHGSAPNFVVDYLQHVTINADGTVTVVIDTFSEQCRG
jgi:hypothetical protein